MGVVENEIFVNLLDQSDLFEKLENEVTADQKIEPKWSIEPQVNDFVLAKFYTDDSFTWCRAQITGKKDSNFYIFFFDYGNFN